MAKGRKKGCPVNIRNWLVYILDVGTQEFVRIYGLNKLNRAIESETEDGSAETDPWAEPYVTKRSGSITLEGKPVVEEATGVKDAGQEMLESYANAVGCEGDATLKFVDPYGHAWKADYIITNFSEDADDSGNTVSWDLEQVGEIELLPYVAVTGISAKDGEAVAETVEMKVGDAAKLITLAFTPEGASNKRFRVTNSKRTVATVGSITEEGFSITPIAAGTTNITVTTVSGAKTAVIRVNVTA